METRTLPLNERPAIEVSPDDLQEFLLAHHTVELMRLQGFDPDQRPSLSVTVDGEERWAGAEPFGSRALRVILPAEVESGSMLVFLLLKDEDGTWCLGNTTLIADEDDYGRPEPREDIELALKALG